MGTRHESYRSGTEPVNPVLVPLPLLMEHLDHRVVEGPSNEVELLSQALCPGWGDIGMSVPLSNPMRASCPPPDRS